MDFGSPGVCFEAGCLREPNRGNILLASRATKLLLFYWFIGIIGLLVYLLVYWFIGILIGTSWYSSVRLGSSVHRYVLVHRFIGTFWFIGSSIRLGSSVHWYFIGLLVHWYIGSSVHLYIGSSLHWCISLLVYRCISVSVCIGVSV